LRDPKAFAKWALADRQGGLLFAVRFEPSVTVGLMPRPGNQLGSGMGVPPMNHAQDARATLKLHHYHFSNVIDGCGEI
jgi:hypothetical protein